MKLKELRNAKGLSQSQFATAVNMSVRTLQAYESGARDINGCNLTYLIKMSNILECKVIDLLDNEELIELFKTATFK